jgi:hypothetical protein
LIVAGLTGYGKTHWLRRGLDSSRRLVVIDPLATLDRERAAAGKNERAHWDDCDLWDYEALRDCPDPILTHELRIVVDPRSYVESVVGRRVSRILEFCWAIGDLDIVLEEAGQYSRWAVSLIHRCMSAGGHRGLRMFLIAQSLGRITIDARRNARRIMLFPQADHSDMAMVRKVVGDTKAQELRRMKLYDPPVLWEQGQLEEQP